jgi:hypothetical protein
MMFDFDLPPLTDSQRRVLRSSISLLILLFTTALAVALGALWSIAVHTVGWKFYVFGTTLGILAVLDVALYGLLVSVFVLTSTRKTK